MGKFYIETSEVGVSGKYMIFEMSATTDVAVAISNSLSQYPIEDGTILTDHVVESPKVITLSGIITDIASITVNVGNNKQPFRTDMQVELVREYIETLEQKIADRETFSIYFSNILKPVTNCFITRFSFSKNNTLGGESWEISLEATKIRQAVRAEFVYAPNVDFRALLAQPKKAASTKNSCDSSKVSPQIENTNPVQKPLSYDDQRFISYNYFMNGEPPPELKVTPEAITKKVNNYKPNVPLEVR